MTLRFLMVAFCALGLSSRMPAQQYTFSITPATAVPGSTGNVNLDVMLTYTGSGPSTAIGGFQFRISSGSTSGLTFTGLSEGIPASGYLFGSNGLGLTATLPGGGAAFPGSVNDFIGNDLHLADGVTLSSGQTLRLGRVTYDLAPGVTPGTSIPIDFIMADSGLSNITGNPITGIAFSPGSITPTPEPTMAFFTVGFIVALGSFSRSRLCRRGAASH